VKIVIMGCGRVGSTLAGRLHREGHDVTVIDTDANAFRRLPDDFGGRTLIGSGVDDRVLRRAGIETADAFIALTQGDNRNLLASQKAKHLFNVQSVVTRVYDPYRAELFGEIGLQTFSPTNISVDLAHEALSNATASAAGEH